MRTLIPATAALGAAAVGYVTVVERNWFALRRYDVPVLPPGAAPLRVLHISDTHLTPGRKRLMAWVRSLDELDPDLVVNTGDCIAHPEAVGCFLDSLGPLLDRPGVFVYGSNDLYRPRPKNPARYLWETSARRYPRHDPDLPWQKLGDTLVNHFDGIAAYCDHPVRFGVVESLNTTIKGVLRRARGMRDEAMLLLKLKWATARPIRSSRDLARFLQPQTLHSNR